jgi:hypothetical protein
MSDVGAGGELTARREEQESFVSPAEATSASSAAESVENVQNEDFLDDCAVKPQQHQGNTAWPSTDERSSLIPHDALLSSGAQPKLC